MTEKMTNAEKEEMKENLKKGIEKIGKEISENDLSKVVEILEPFRQNINWECGWEKFGFYKLYLIIANLEAESEKLFEIVKCDKVIGWYAGDRNIELGIFRHKCVNIILDQKVKIKT